MKFNENYNHSSNDVIEACGFNEEYFQTIAQKLFDEFNQDIPASISAKIQRIEEIFNSNPKVMTRFLCMMVGSIGEHLKEVAAEVKLEAKAKKDVTKNN